MNDTTTEDNDQGSKYDLVTDKSLANVITWCAAFVVIAVSIIVANILTIAVFGGKHIQRKRTHFFLINLSTADLMVGSVAVPLWVIIIYQDSASPRWQHKPIISVLYFTVDMLTGFASFFSVAAIALERLYSVIKPVKYRLLKSRRYFLAISCIWLSAGVVVLLKFVRFNIYTVYLNIVFLCLGLPLVATVLSYFVIFMKMRKRISNRHRSQRRRSHEDDIKLAWTLFLVTAIFFITWTPFVIINALYIYICLSGACPNISRDVIYFTKLLQYGNSCVNPIIYVVRIPAFQKAVVNTLNLRCFGKRSRSYNSRSRAGREIPLDHLKRKCGNQDPFLSTVINRMSVTSSYIKSDENLNFGVQLGITRLWNCKSWCCVCAEWSLTKLKIGDRILIASSDENLNFGVHLGISLG